MVSIARVLPVVLASKALKDPRVSLVRPVTLARLETQALLAWMA